MKTFLNKLEFRYVITAIISLLILFLFRYSLISSSFHLPDSSYLLLHTLLELFSIFVSFSIFVQARLTFSANPQYFFIGLVFFAVGCFDLIHTFTYKGMPFIVDQLSVARATWFWIIARLTESVGVALFILKPGKFMGKNSNLGTSLSLVYIVIVSSIILFIPGRLPVLIHEGVGMTSFKISLEYVITVINLSTFIILLSRYKAQPNDDSLRFLVGIFFIMVGELFFTIYHNVFDLENLIGHIFKFTGYLFLYRALFFPHIQQILTSKEEAEKKQLEAETKLHEVEKNLSHQIFEAHEEERKKVSRDLHDGIGQSLYSILITINTVRRETSVDKKNAILDTVRTITENAMKEVREIAHSLRPSSLDDLGFIPTLRSYLETYKQIHNIPIKFDITGNVGRLNPSIETALYRICQESLTNSAKYANPSLIEVTIHIDDGEARLMIKDNGNGFEVDDYLKKRERKGIGLFSIKERAEGLGGMAEINSKLKEGTTIFVRIPR